VQLVEKDVLEGRYNPHNQNLQAGKGEPRWRVLLSAGNLCPSRLQLGLLGGQGVVLVQTATNALNGCVAQMDRFLRGRPVLC
jgi:hypothetical protein